MGLIFPFFTGAPLFVRFKPAGYKRAPKQNKPSKINVFEDSHLGAQGMTLERGQRRADRAPAPCAARRGNQREDFFDLPVLSSLTVRFKLATFSVDFHAAAFLLAAKTCNPGSPGTLVWPPTLPHNTRAHTHARTHARARTRTHASGRTQDGAGFVMGGSHPRLR